MSFESLLIHTCTIQALTETFNATSKQPVHTWADSVLSVKCRLDQARGMEYRTPAAIYSKATHILYLKNRTLNAKTNRIVIDSNTYNILSVEQASGMDHHLEVVLERIV